MLSCWYKLSQFCKAKYGSPDVWCKQRCLSSRNMKERKEKALFFFLEGKKSPALDLHKAQKLLLEEIYDRTMRIMCPERKQFEENKSATYCNQKNLTIYTPENNPFRFKVSPGLSANIGLTEEKSPCQFYQVNLKKKTKNKKNRSQTTFVSSKSKITTSVVLVHGTGLESAC